MRTTTRLLLLPLALPVVLAGCGAEARHNRASVVLTGDQLTQQFPWLAETSGHWTQEVDLGSGSVPGYSGLGCYAAGNGRVFTTEGLRYPFGSMTNTFGPTYQKNQGSLGHQEITLLVGGKPYPLPIQRMEYVTRSGVIHAELSDGPGGVRLDLYDCVPPKGYSICRVVRITNAAQRSRRNVSLAVGHAGAAGEAREGRLAADGPRRWVRIGFAGSRTRTEEQLYTVPLPPAAQAVNKGVAETVGSSVLCPLGTLGPGESLTKLAYTVIAPSAAEADAEEQRLAQVGFGVLQECRDWWQAWFADALTVETSDPRINEFIPIQQYLCRLQQADLGGYAPMYMYTTCWVRDSNGPVRFMTQSGKFAEVKRYLDYYYACCAREKRIPMNWPLDLPVPPAVPPVDWSKAPTERAEVASFLILQHYWYWLQSGDLTPVGEHWGYLRRNLLGQQVDERGRLPFHGDETYRFPGYEIFQLTQKEPTDWVSMDLLSADSGWECVAAARALATWAKLLGKADEAAEYERLGRRVRDALDRDFRMDDRGYYAPAISDFSGERYRYPFANIALGPAWLNAGLDTPWSAVTTPLRYLWKDSGTVQTTPGCGYYVGMTPGYVVWNLKRMSHPSLDQAIKGLLDAASPAAEYSEMIAPDDNPTDKYWGKNRIRPWEGGINGEALVYALSGLEVNAEQRAVRLDPSVPELTIRNVRVGNSFLDADCRVRGGEGKVRVSVRGAYPVAVGLGEFGPVEVRPGESRSLPFRRPHGAIRDTPGLPLARQPFAYGEPTFAGRAKTVVVTWSRDTFAAYRGRPSPAAIDTKIAFPPEYLAAALYDTAGRRRADTLVLDVSKYPGHCKTAEFWSAGEGGRIVNRFRGLGGRVEQHPNPQSKPGDLFGQ